MDIQAFDHLNITVRDFRESVDWYGRVFGFSLVEEDVKNGVRWGIVRSRGGEGEQMLCLYEYPDSRFLDRLELKAQGIHGMNHFAFRIDDEARWEETIRREGFDVSPWEWPHSKAWYVTDPTGYEIEVVFWKEGRARFEPLKTGIEL